MNKSDGQFLTRKRKLGQIGKQASLKTRRLQRVRVVPGGDDDPVRGTLKQNEEYSVVTRVFVKNSLSFELAENESIHDVKKYEDGKCDTSVSVLERGDSGYGTDGSFEQSDELDESDIIIPNKLSRSFKETQPKSINKSTSWSRLSGDSPAENHLFQFGDLDEHTNTFGFRHKSAGTPVDTPIRITHEYEDTDQGDEFGVTLRSYESVVNGEKVRQHFLVHVERKGPADKMAIRNGDELALLNDIFVPEKTHDELIDIFHHVKVDGNTRLTLVIRRISKETLGSRRKSSKAKRTWEWMETSAILAPDYKHILNERPIVEDCYNEVIHSPDYNQGFVRCRYRTSGRNLYIDISKQGQLIANHERSYEGDQTKILLKHRRCGNDAAGNLTFDAALSDLERKYYINIRNDTVSLESKPDWFKVNDRAKRIGAEGSEVVFMKNDVFLACDEEDGKITTNPNIYRFTEIQYRDYDTIDSGTWAREANNPRKANTRKQNMSLCLYTREPPCPQVNDVDSAGNSLLESTPSDTDVDVCGPDTDLYTQPKSSKTPTTPMEGLFIC